jgi:hypothetical protein
MAGVRSLICRPFRRLLPACSRAAFAITLPGAAVLARSRRNRSSPDPRLADAELAAQKYRLLSRKIAVSGEKFSITHFSRRNPDLAKSMIYARELAKIVLSLFKLSNTQLEQRLSKRCSG